MTASGPWFSQELRSKVPPMIVMFEDQRAFWTLFGLGLAVLVLDGRDHNGILILLGSWLCPPIAAALHLIWPFNPYKNTYARLASMANKDQTDREARRLVEIFQSAASRRFLFRTAARMSLLLLVTTTLLAVVYWRSVQWSFTSPWFGEGLIGGSIGAYMALLAEYMHWGLKQWAATASRTDDSSSLRLP